MAVIIADERAGLGGRLTSTPAVVAALLYLAYSAVATVVAIDLGFAYEFGGRGDPTNVSGEWVARGTGLSAPPAPLIALVLCAVLALWPNRWWGAVGAAGIALLGILFVIAGAGEGVWADRFNAFAKLLQTVGLLLAAALVVFGAHQAGGWWRRRLGGPP